MADLELRVDVFGDTVIARRLSRFGEGIKDFSPAFEEIVKLFRQQTRKHFDSNGSGSWAPLSPAYAEWKRANYPGKPIMRLSDTLYDTLTNGAGLGIEEIRPMSLRWGTGVPYGRFHQQGAGRLPRRKIVDFDEATKKGVMKELQKFVVSLRDKEQ